MDTVNIGIIGGGLMGREMASAFARWCALEDMPAQPRLVGIADTNPKALEWFAQLPSVALKTTDYHELLASPDIDVCYVAVPHNLHLQIYLDVLKAGKDLLAEKPFGIDLAAAQSIVEAIANSSSFVRCSSEFPFFPGAHRVFQACQQHESLGRILEISAGFHHSSDLDPNKAANWKRLSSVCGEIGVMGDLGMHVMHLPLRLGWHPKSLYAQLQKGYATRPGANGTTVECDTWDNATLHTWTTIGNSDVPMRLEMKRLAPGQTNSWYFEILGTDGGVRYNTKEPKTLRTFKREKEQLWQRTELGFGTPFKTVTGGIFEPGFPDVIQQMWAAFICERAGKLDGRFACVSPEEALTSHRVFAAALESHRDQKLVNISYD